MADAVPILILAAGSSSRMRGRDKLLEEIDGTPLLRRTALRALATGSDVLVALPVRPHPRYAALSGLDITCVPVPDAAEGMNASLRTGLDAVAQDARAVMIVLADMPELTSDDLQTVLNVVDVASDVRIWRATTQSGAAGHPTVFHHTLFDELRGQKGDVGGSSVVKAHAAQTALVPLPDAHARTDLDTPEEWTAWRARRQST